MAYTAKWYGLGLKALLNGTTDIDTDTLKCALMDNTYTPNQDTDETWAGISGDEVSGTGYSAGGATLASVTLTYTGATNTLSYDAADPSWSDSTITARYAVFYSSTSGYLISYIDFGEDKTSTAGLFKIELDSAGIGKITLS